MKLAIVGSEGRMGRELVTLAHSAKYRPAFAKIVAVTHKDDFSVIAKEVDIAIDFSVVEATLNHAKICTDHDCKYVCGVTGFTKEQLNILEECAKITPMFWAPNMSLGVAITNELVKKAAQMFDDDFEASIKETHHTKKLDAPSGTALMLRNSVINFRDVKVDIESERVGDVVGVHTVQFKSELESVEIRHEAFSRSLFADGALKVAIWLTKQKAGKLYNMKDFVGLV